MNNTIETIKTQFLNDLGDVINDFLLDGNYHRHKSLWAIGSSWIYKGNEYHLVTYGDWKTGRQFSWKNFDPRKESRAFNKKAGKAIEEIKAISELEKQKKHKECRDKWKPIFDSSDKGELHKYLMEKNVSDNHHGKIGMNGELFIPAYNRNGFVGVQMIFWELENEKYEKRFSSGIELKGSFSLFGQVDMATDYVYVCEGFATGATIHEITAKPVFMLWNCHNIIEGILSIRLKYPHLKLVLCADNDHSRIDQNTGKIDNIGVRKMLFAKNKFSNCVVKIPEFEFKDSNLTDFNDLLSVSDVETLNEQLDVRVTDFVNVVPLGRAGKKFYYFSSETKQVVDLSPAEHTKNYFLTLAPAKYWGDVYGWKRDKDGEILIGRPDWDRIHENVLDIQRQKGFFNPKNVRGYGCWIDENRYVVNLGNKYLVNNEVVENFKTKYLYESNDPIDIDLDNPLSDLECKQIVDCFSMLNYKNKSDFVYLIAWIGQAQIFGSLDWRFQLWLTGPRGSGKTEILKMVSALVFNSEIYQSVTSASIRQHLKSNSIPMIIDEAEPNNHESKKRMDSVIELIRQCSSRMNTKSLRGTASGDALEYNINSCFVLSSIQSYLPTMADHSRFFEIEMLTNNDQKSDQWQKIQKSFELIRGFAPRLFARQVKNLDLIRENTKKIKKVLIDSELISDPRAGDQISSAISSFLSLETSEPIVSYDRVVEIAQMLNLGASDYEQQNELDESQNCFDEILDSIIDKSNNRTIGYYLNAAFGEEALEAYGLRKLDFGQVFIHTANRELKKLLSDSMYSNLKSILKRHPNYIDSTALRLGGRVRKGVTMRF